MAFFDTKSSLLLPYISTYYQDFRDILYWISVTILYYFSSPYGTNISSSGQLDFECTEWAVLSIPISPRYHKVVRNSLSHLTMSSFSVTGLWKPIFLQVTGYSLLNQAFYFTSPLGNRKLMKVNYLLHRPTPTNFLCSPYCYIYTLPYVKESSLTYSPLRLSTSPGEF